MNESLSVDELQVLANDPEKAAARVFEVLDAMATADEEQIAWMSDCMQVVDIAKVDLQAIAKYCDHQCAAAAVWACKLLGREPSEATKYQTELCQALASHADIYVRQQAASSLRKATTLDDKTTQALTAAAQNPDPRLKRLAQQALESAA